MTAKSVFGLFVKASKNSKGEPQNIHPPQYLVERFACRLRPGRNAQATAEISNSEGNCRRG
jgi:hypothetical protein